MIVDVVDVVLCGHAVENVRVEVVVVDVDDRLAEAAGELEELGGVSRQTVRHDHECVGCVLADGVIAILVVLFQAVESHSRRQRLVDELDGVEATSRRVSIERRKEKITI